MVIMAVNQHYIKLLTVKMLDKIKTGKTAAYNYDSFFVFLVHEIFFLTLSRISAIFLNFASMNYRQARIFLISTIIIIVLLIAGLIFRPRITPDKPIATESSTTATSTAATPKSEPKPKPATTVKQLIISSRVGNLASQFNDMNAEHLAYAQKIGIKPIRATSDILRLKKPIVEVKSNDNYHIDKLSHSYAYLVPKAAELLDTIGARFNHKLSSQGGGRYKIKVTSLLRTNESVNRLKKGNVNSTGNSAHLYGTTFDISYVGFHEGALNTRRHTDGELKNLLAEVLLELREEGRCLVKYERKQGCFHITATGR